MAIRFRKRMRKLMIALALVASVVSPAAAAEIYLGYMSPNGSQVKSEVHRAYAQFCERKWSDDYRMQLYCQNKQKIAAEQLAKFELTIEEKAGTTAAQVATGIFKFCRAKWSDDYSMSIYCVKNQTEAYNQLQDK